MVTWLLTAYRPHGALLQVIHDNWHQLIFQGHDLLKHKTDISQRRLTFIGKFPLLVNKWYEYQVLHNSPNTYHLSECARSWYMWGNSIMTEWNICDQLSPNKWRSAAHSRFLFLAERDCVPGLEKQKTRQSYCRRCLPYLAGWDVWDEQIESWLPKSAGPILQWMNSNVRVRVAV